MFTTYPDYIGDIVECEVHGVTFRATLEYDHYHGVPWQEEDGHGPVSDWVRRDKRAGELVLCEDSGSYLYYDFQEASKIAKRDGWDTAPFGQGTRGERAARAAMADYDRLRKWCSEQGYRIVVTAYHEGIALGSASRWGIESDAGDYLLEVANELLPEALEEARERVARLAKELAS
jgi:hypothetical protein